eukprot:c15538_g1_i2 orf=195-410(+)
MTEKKGYHSDARPDRTPWRMSRLLQTTQNITHLGREVKSAHGCYNSPQRRLLRGTKDKEPAEKNIHAAESK